MYKKQNYNYNRDGILIRYSECEYYNEIQTKIKERVNIDFKSCSECIIQKNSYNEDGYVVFTSLIQIPFVKFLNDDNLCNDKLKQKIMESIRKYSNNKLYKLINNEKVKRTIYNLYKDKDNPDNLYETVIVDGLISKTVETKKLKNNIIKRIENKFEEGELILNKIQLYSKSDKRIISENITKLA